MNTIVPSEKIQQLEQRHVQLLDELDELNARLDEALSGFVKSPQGDQEAGSPTC